MREVRPRAGAHRDRRDRRSADPVGRPAHDEQGSADGARRTRARVAAAAGRARGDGVRRRHADRRASRSAFARRRCSRDGSRWPAACRHDEMPNYYAAADVFVSGSHSEGSGYALIEAMSAGVVPVVTDIPSFRAIAGDAASDGRRAMPTTSPRALLDDLLDGSRRVSRRAVQARFDRVLSWDAIGAPHRAEYQALLDARDAMKIAIVVPGGLHPSGTRAGRAVVAGAVRTAGEVARHPRVRVEASAEAADLFAARIHRARSRPAVGAARPDALGAGAGARTRARRSTVRSI